MGDGKRRPDQELGRYGGGVLDVKFNRDGNLVSCGRDMSTKLWDQNGSQIRAFPNMPDIAVSTTCCDESKRIITSDWQGNISVWNAADAAVLGTLAANPPTLNERLVATNNEASAHQAELAPLSETMKTTQEQLASLQQNLDASRQKLNASQTELSAAQTATDALNQSVATWTGEKTGFEGELAKNKEAQPLLTSSFNRAMEAAKKLPDAPELQKTAESVGEQVKQLDARIAGLEGQINDRTEKLRVANESIAKQSEIITQKQAEVTVTTADVQKLESQLPPLKRQVDELTQKVTGIQTQLAAAQAQAVHWQSEIDFVAKIRSLQTQLANRRGLRSSATNRGRGRTDQIE